jgi:hypothetical protein
MHLPPLDHAQTLPAETKKSEMHRNHNASAMFRCITDRPIRKQLICSACSLQYQLRTSSYHTVTHISRAPQLLCSLAPSLLTLPVYSHNSDPRPFNYSTRTRGTTFPPTSFLKSLDRGSTKYFTAFRRTRLYIPFAHTYRLFDAHSGSLCTSKKSTGFIRQLKLTDF